MKRTILLTLSLVFLMVALISCDAEETAGENTPENTITVEECKKNLDDRGYITRLADEDSIKGMEQEYSQATGTEIDIVASLNAYAREYENKTLGAIEVARIEQANVLKKTLKEQLPEFLVLTQGKIVIAVNNQREADDMLGKNPITPLDIYAKNVASIGAEYYILFRGAGFDEAFESIEAMSSTPQCPARVSAWLSGMVNGKHFEVIMFENEEMAQNAYQFMNNAYGETDDGVELNGVYILHTSDDETMAKLKGN